MKHKHSEMIKAKADNMDLVKFAKSPLGGWAVCIDQNGANACRFEPAWEYFLCAPELSDLCLKFLNGEDLQVSLTSGWTDVWQNECFSREWSNDSAFMQVDAFEMRIKPRKEKRWIAINLSRGVYAPLYHSRKQAEEACPHADQFVEIEVETEE